MESHEGSKVTRYYDDNETKDDEVCAEDFVMTFFFGVQLQAKC